MEPALADAPNAAAASFAGCIVDGRYRIIEPVATGSMGQVYRGERLKIARPVAIKFLLPLLVNDEEFRSRFEREVQILSRLDHPNCISVFDYGVYRSSPYLVMEFVQGKTLDALLDGGRLPVDRAVNLARQLLSGLAHAHGQGIVHRDIKPANLLVTDVTGAGEFLRVVDFGLAKLQTATARDISVNKFVVGTPCYMSPEQANGLEADERSDVYSAAVVLFELLTGSKPFFSEDPFEVMEMHRRERPPRLRDAGDKIKFSAELEGVIAKALAKKPHDRYASAMEFSHVLDEVTSSAVLVDATDGLSIRTIEHVLSPGGAKGGATHASADARPQSLIRRRWWSWIVLATALVVAGAAANSLEITASDVFSAPAELAQLVRTRGGAVVSAELGEPSSGVAAGSTPSTDQPSQPVDETIDATALADAGGADAVQQDIAVIDQAEIGSMAGPSAPTEVQVANESADDEEQVDSGEGDEAIPVEDEAATDDMAGSGVAAGAAIAGPSQPRTWTFAVVAKLLREGHSTEALRGANRLLRENPKSAYGHYLRGNIYFQRKWWTEGIKSYSRAIEINGAYRKNSRIIRDAIAALGSTGTRGRARRFLSDTIGRRAIPYLRKAATSAPGGAVRREAGRLADQLKRRRR